MRKVLKLSLILVVTYLFLLGGFYAAMCQKPAAFSSIMARTPGLVFMIFPFRTMWFSAREGKLRVGNKAPDFSLETYDKTSRVQLSAFKGKKPVVLVFGSYT
jgi:hypothetical protein